MKPSQNCLDLISKWEGIELDAYIDPVGIPTIGIGTTRYPDGRAVMMGHRISEEQAWAFLLHDLQGFAREVQRLISVSLNQNQFDALVSFTYNVGAGALESSTLRRKLNKNDYDGAANEFKRWNKGKVNGVLKVLPGLVNRRKDEEALFRRVDNPGTPLEDTESPQDSVTWLELFRQEEDTLVVARNGGQVVEVTRLANKHKDDLIAVLQQYKNANNVFVAHADKNLPEGEVVIMTGHELPPKKVINPPTLNLPLLIFGMEDQEGGGNDIRELQQRLKELGYYDRDIDGKFGRGTDIAVKNFQAKFFGRAEADGKVGPLTWKKLWGEQVAVPDRDLPISTKPYLSLTRTDQKDQFGCYVLALEYIKNDKIEGRINVCSGSRDKQNFRKGANSVSGSREPLPEGRWFIHDISWAGG